MLRGGGGDDVNDINLLNSSINIFFSDIVHKSEEKRDGM